MKSFFRKEKKTIAIAIFVLIALSSISYAGRLQLDERNITNGKVVTDTNVYNIVYYTETYRSDGSIAKNIIVENQNEIDTLENQSVELFAQVENISNEFRALNANASEINEKRQNIADAVELINQQKQIIKNDTAQIQERKAKVDDVLTSNVALSPLAFRVGLIVFVMLLILVIAANTTGIFSRGRPREKTPYEEED